MNYLIVDNDEWMICDDNYLAKKKKNTYIIDDDIPAKWIII